MPEAQLLGRAEVKLEAAAGEQPEGTVGYFAGPLLTFDQANRNGDVVTAGSLPEARGITLGREHNEYIQPVAVISSYNRNGGVEIEGHWLDTQAGRDAQTEARARQAAGGTVGISYGIHPDELHKLSAAEIKAGMKRKLKSGELVEASLVQHPAVAGAHLRQVASTEDTSTLQAAIDALTERVDALEAGDGNVGNTEDTLAAQSAKLDARERELDEREAALRSAIDEVNAATRKRSERSKSNV